MKPTPPANPRVAVLAAVGNDWTGIAELRVRLKWPTWGGPSLVGVVRQLVKEGTFESVEQPVFRFRRRRTQ